MKKIDITEEQEKDFNQSLLDKIKSFFKEVFHADKPLHGKELDEHLFSKTKSEEEKETLAEVFDEIDLFHQKRKEFVESGKEIDVWYEEEIERIVKQIKPDASQGEINQVKEAVAAQIDGDIESTAQALEKMVSLVREAMEKEEKA